MLQLLQRPGNARCADCGAPGRCGPAARRGAVGPRGCGPRAAAARAGRRPGCQPRAGGRAAAAPAGLGGAGRGARLPLGWGAGAGPASPRPPALPPPPLPQAACLVTRRQPPPCETRGSAKKEEIPAGARQQGGHGGAGPRLLRGDGGSAGAPTCGDVMARLQPPPPPALRWERGRKHLPRPRGPAGKGVAGPLTPKPGCPGPWPLQVGPWAGAVSGRALLDFAPGWCLRWGDFLVAAALGLAFRDRQEEKRLCSQAPRTLLGSWPPRAGGAAVGAEAGTAAGRPSGLQGHTGCSWGRLA